MATPRDPARGDIDAPYRHVSLAVWQEPVAFLDDGLLWDLWKRVSPRYGPEDAVIAGARDRSGVVSSRTPQRLAPDDFTVTSGELDSFAYSLQPRSDRWEPPFLTVGVTRPGFGNPAWYVSWSVMAAAISEEEYCELARSFLSEAHTSGLEAFGFAGVTSQDTGGELNSTIFHIAEVNSSVVDLRRAIAGVHWMNLVPRELLTTEMRDAVRSLGASVVDGSGSTLVALADRPSRVTDEIVRECMEALASVDAVGHAKLPSDWWRRSWP